MMVAKGNVISLQVALHPSQAVGRGGVKGQNRPKRDTTESLSPAQALILIVIVPVLPLVILVRRIRVGGQGGNQVAVVT